MLGALGPIMANLPAGGVRNYGGRGHGRGGQRQPYFVLLVLQLLHRISSLQRKPPLTLALMAGMSVLHLKPDLLEAVTGVGGGGAFSNWSWFSPDHVRSVCMMPATMLDTFERTGGLELRRFFLSAFVHGDDMHLYYNMASFLLKGVSLELAMGSQAFAVLLAFSLVTSQVLMLLSSWLLLTVFDMPGPMQTCTVGFSGVLFALKYVLSRQSPGVVSVLGFRVHTRYAAWLELALISFLVPNASFLGHLCGILAGILYVELPIVLPILSLLSGFSLFRQAPSYTYSSGTSTLRPAPHPHDGDNVASVEEAELQEALRRSRVDVGARGGAGGGNGFREGGGGGHGFGGGSAGGGSSGWSERERSDGTATVESRRETPSAPSEDMSGEEQASGGEISLQELRRRRVERHIVL